MAQTVFPQREKIGLYDPAFEHDACGVAFVARLDGVARHEIVAQGLEALRNLDHRGATGADVAVQSLGQRRFRENFPRPDPAGRAGGGRSGSSRCAAG